VQGVFAIFGFSDTVTTMNTQIHTKVTKLPDSQIKIEATIPVELVLKLRARAIKQMQDSLEIDGFRKGHIPESVILEKVGEPGIWAEMAEQALTEYYPTIITQSNTSPIGRPQIQITKLAPDNDVEYAIISDVMPTVVITDVQKIAQQHNAVTESIEVTDDEVTSAVREIRQMRAHDKMHQDGVDHHDHNHQNIPDEQLPELDDAFVKSLGNFENVDDFMTKLRENLTKEKEARAHEKRRIGMIESMITAGTFDIPGSMVDFELDKMLEQFKYDLSLSGMKWEDYLGHIAKTLDEVKTEWRDQARKRVHTQLLLEKIAEDFSITPDKEKIDTQVAQILEMYKEQAVEQANVVAYVTQMQTNAAVFDWLDTQK